jgi:hypothetical protein
MSSSTILCSDDHNAIPELSTSSPLRFFNMTMNAVEISDTDDPYDELEQDSDATKRFVKDANKFCLMSLEDPTMSPRYERILKILESDERIPYVSKMGSTENGDDELYNLWRDSKVRCECVSKVP